MLDLGGGGVELIGGMVEARGLRPCARLALAPRRRQDRLQVRPHRPRRSPLSRGNDAGIVQGEAGYPIKPKYDEGFTTAFTASTAELQVTTERYADTTHPMGELIIASNGGMT